MIPVSIPKKLRGVNLLPDKIALVHLERYFMEIWPSTPQVEARKPNDSMWFCLPFSWGNWRGENTGSIETAKMSLSGIPLNCPKTETETVSCSQSTWIRTQTTCLERVEGWLASQKILVETKGLFYWKFAKFNTKKVPSYFLPRWRNEETGKIKNKCQTRIRSTAVASTCLRWEAVPLTMMNTMQYRSNFSGVAEIQWMTSFRPRRKVQKCFKYIFIMNSTARASCQNKVLRLTQKMRLLLEGPYCTWSCGDEVVF